MRVRNAHMCTHRILLFYFRMNVIQRSQEKKREKKFVHTICVVGLALVLCAPFLYSAAATTAAAAAAVDDIVVSLSTFLIR